VTAACLVLRRELYDELGGMDEALRVAFNDVDLCLRLRDDAGRALVYTPFADLLHLESASRGEDESPERLARTAAEADHLRSKHGSFALRDPFYSPNLSLDGTDAALAFPPRVTRPWLVESVERPRVAFLTYRLMKGYGVDVVVAEQMEYLCARGYDVTALVLEKDDHYDRRLALYVDTGQLRIIRVRSPEEAVAKVAAMQCEVAIAHTPPFHQLTSQLPASVFRVLFDHGEPPPEFFPEPEGRRRIALAKRAAARSAELAVAISDFVRADSGLVGARVCRNGNDHMLRRRSNLARLAGTFREEHGLGDAFIVLNVTRYLAEERRYKGVEEFAAVRDALLRARPDLADRVRFVIAGRSEAEDRAWAQSRGLVAASNLGDDQLLAAYLDADLYLSTSQWEGYNLGIGQALAVGVPALASARGAHPEFPIRTSNSPEELAAWILEEIARTGSGAGTPRAPALRRLREASVVPWKSAAAELETLLRDGMERHGRSTSRWPSCRTLPRADAVAPEVSFIILNKDRPDLLVPCVRSIEEQCDVPYEILIGDTGSTDAETLRFYEETPHAVHYLGFYNFSACNNILAARARGRHLLFLNNDTQLIQTRLSQATEYLATHEDVGCLGAYLVYADGRLQHAGVRICPEGPYRGIPEHFDRLKPLEGYPGLERPRDVVAVTGAMLLIPAERFRSLGGFDEVYQEEAQDIDLCLRLRDLGFRSIVHPALHAFHYENSTRTVREAPADRAEFLRRFGRVIEEELFAWQAEAGLA
jgi:GT2 family glycosyltransferase